MSDTGARDHEDFLARVRRSNAETEKFIEEAFKLRAEEAKLRAEERKLGRDAIVAPITTFIAAISAMGALIISIVTLLRLHG